METAKVSRRLASLPPLIQQLVEAKLTRYCEEKVPLAVRDRLCLSFRIKGNYVTLFEKRVIFDKPGKWVECNVAKFRYGVRSGEWTLYYRDRNAEWHLYPYTQPTRDFEKLVQEVDSDPTHIFWV